ncbi:hypothetical protein [Photobacterium damselae]|uniref:hypothetical protein n=1 Tax=Photobacterium damselae TaxID=38293 RepID=UPI000D660536|nr:hypothetical protein [Photobacterium damselae]AWK84403.1 hypothetical protein BST98_17635 [Photobacterium damselae]
MSKISIAYIGDKPFKKDTITGSLLVFPQYQPIDVEAPTAFMLLQYPKVWVRSEDIEVIKEQKQLAANERAKLLEDEQKEQEALEFAKSMVVTVAGENLDLAKLPSVKLATLIEANDWKLEPKGAQESVDEFRTRVRDFIRGL